MKLTIEQAQEIRIRYANESVSQAKLASEYGVTQPAIYNIVNGISHTSYLQGIRKQKLVQHVRYYK